MSSTQIPHSAPIVINAPPPQDLGSYARYMSMHTKRQMEAANRASHRRSSGSASASLSSSVSSSQNRTGNDSYGPTVMPNGVVASPQSTGVDRYDNA